MGWTFEAELLVLHLPDGDLASVQVPLDVTAQIREQTPRKPFGSVRVVANIGAVTWRTIVVSDRESGTFALPIKKKVREESGAEPGDRIVVTIRLADD